MNAIDSTDSSLRDHASRCVQSLSPLFTVRCALESLHGFLMPRFVTTMALASVLLALSGMG